MPTTEIIFDDAFDVSFTKIPKEDNSKYHPIYYREYEIYIGDYDGGIQLSFRTEYAFKEFIRKMGMIVDEFRKET